MLAWAIVISFWEVISLKSCETKLTIGVKYLYIGNNIEMYSNYVVKAEIVYSRAQQAIGQI